MNADLGPLHIERTAEHIRFTWACIGHDDHVNVENPWEADTAIPAALAAMHTNETGHQTVVIRESRQVTTITRKAD